MDKESKPLIGVFVLHHTIRNIKRKNYDFHSYVRMKELAKAGQEAQVSLFYFSTLMVDSKNESIRGLYWSAKFDEWKEKVFPFPDVLYDRRGTGGSEKYSMLAQNIGDIFARKNIKKVNSNSFFDKVDVYRRLKEVPEVSHYVPITELCEGDEDLILFLSNHPRAYLKAGRGGRGKQVLSVVKLPDKSYQISYMHDQIFTQIAAGAMELIDLVRKYFNGRSFVMQKEIDLIQIGASKVDFRAELQRNGRGQLEVAGICGRLGQENAPITIHSNAFPFQTFLRQFQLIPEQEIDSLTSKVHQFLLDIYLTLEKLYGTFGEIGIDFGIDKNGEIWFIEPNSRSAKVSMQKAYDPQTFHRTFLNPVEYAKYICLEKARTD
ncbi:YheC/YheD family protein [Gorillibacterium massiliense]|uniref:YheC/YheD family endospore coat-associated protein n=1 Tax=Gorillibacterium massiliense TaxID=1280390 RepID=UPI0004B7DF83|nr:YheC/YheD family protein [Gorillibacterium massiliense]